MGRENLLEESDPKLIMTPAVKDFIEKLHIRMSKRNVEAADPKKTLKADLESAHSMIEAYLDAVLTIKLSIHRRAAEETAMKEQLEEAREQRLRQEKKEAADREHQEKKEAADREHQEKKEAADREHRKLPRKHVKQMDNKKVLSLQMKYKTVPAD